MPYKDLASKVTLRTQRIKAVKPTLTQEQFAALRNCRRSPAYFLTTFGKITHPIRGKIPFTLYDFQGRVVSDFVKNLCNIVLKSRQMGISWLVSGFVLWLAMFFEEKNILMISIKKQAAKRLLDKVKYLYDNLPDWMRLAIIEDTQTCIKFSNGSRIESIPTSEDAGRSEGVSLVVIDEAASVRWIKEIWKAVYPTISTGGMCVLISTPKGMGEFFQKMWTKAISRKNNFNPIFVPWWEHPEYSIGLEKRLMHKHDGRVVEQYWSPWYEKMSRDLGPRATAQELDCEFLSSGANFFDLHTIIPRQKFVSSKAVFKTRQNGDLRIFKHAEPNTFYVMGIDTASGHGDDYSWAIVRDYVTKEQVATMRTSVPVNVFSERCVELAWEYNGAFVVGEENGISIATLLQMRDVYGYPEDNFYHDIIITDKTGEPTERLGWNNNMRSRALYLRKLEQLVREEPKTFKDSRVLDEYVTFIVNKNGKPIAMDDCNDDAVMADLCCLIGLLHHNPYGALPFKIA